jgi:PKD repeat protein
MYGCADDTTFTVTVHPTPLAALSVSETAACADTPVQLVNGAQHADAVAVLANGAPLWNTASPVPGSTFSTSFANETDAPLVVALTQVATTAAGCTATTSVEHTVYPAVHAAFQLPEAACAPADLAFNNLSSNSSASFAWNFGDGNGDTAVHPTHLFAPEGTANADFPVTLVATSLHGCADTLTQVVTVLGTPLLTLALDSTSGCYPLTAHFHPTVEGAAELHWNFGNGITEQAPVGNLSHTYFNLGTTTVVHTAQVTAHSADGCTATSAVEVPVSPGVQAQFDVVEEGCSPLEAVLVNQSAGAVNYAWNFGDGTTSDEAMPTHNFVNETNEVATFVVQLVATSALGCSDTTAVGVMVHPVPQAQFLATPDHQVFPDATITVNNLSQASANALHTWDFGDGGASQQNQPGLYTYSSWGTYTITLTVDNGFCADGATQEVHIHAPAPVAQFSGGGVGCAPLSVAFDNSSLNAVSYLWDFGDGAQSQELNPVHVYEFPGTYTVKLIATGPEGYLDEIVLEDVVTVRPTPVAAFTYTPDRVVAPDQTVQFIALSSDDALFFLWNFGDGFQSDLENPVHNYRDPGTYDVSLTVQNAEGCQSTHVWPQAVEAIPGGFMIFPTAFTPTTGGATGGVYDPQDLSNDIFHPHHAGIIRYDLSVFNKWGELIFRSTDVGIGWDGYVEGELARQDVYAWKAEAQFSDGRTVRQAGDVTLIIR